MCEETCSLQVGSTARVWVAMHQPTIRLRKGAAPGGCISNGISWWCFHRPTRDDEGHVVYSHGAKVLEHRITPPATEFHWRVEYTGELTAVNLFRAGRRAIGMCPCTHMTISTWSSPRAHDCSCTQFTMLTAAVNMHSVPQWVHVDGHVLTSYVMVDEKDGKLAIVAQPYSFPLIQRIIGIDTPIGIPLICRPLVVRIHPTVKTSDTGLVSDVGPNYLVGGVDGHCYLADRSFYLMHLERRYIEHVEVESVDLKGRSVDPKPLYEPKPGGSTNERRSSVSTSLWDFIKDPIGWSIRLALHHLDEAVLAMQLWSLILNPADSVKYYILGVVFFLRFHIGVRIGDVILDFLPDQFIDTPTLLHEVEHEVGTLWHSVAGWFKTTWHKVF